MLTATYTLVSLSVEQASVRVSLLNFQKYMRSALLRQQSLTLGQLEYACESLHRLYQTCHWRKIEMYLIPAIRQVTEQADGLLDELARLNQAALSVIRSLQEQAGRAGAHSEQQVLDVCAAIDKFCDALLRRLDKEEKELFGIARSVICGDAWFAIANQFLRHDARVAEARRERAAPQLHSAGAPKYSEIPVGVVALPVVLPDDHDDEAPLPESKLPLAVPEMFGHRRHRPASRALAK